MKPRRRLRPGPLPQEVARERPQELRDDRARSLGDQVREAPLTPVARVAGVHRPDDRHDPGRTRPQVDEGQRGECRREHAHRLEERDPPAPNSLQQRRQTEGNGGPRGEVVVEGRPRAHRREHGEKRAPALAGDVAHQHHEEHVRDARDVEPPMPRPHDLERRDSDQAREDEPEPRRVHHAPERPGEQHRGDAVERAHQHGQVEGRPEHDLERDRDRHDRCGLARPGNLVRAEKPGPLRPQAAFPEGLGDVERRRLREPVRDREPRAPPEHARQQGPRQHEPEQHALMRAGGQPRGESPGAYQQHSRRDHEDGYEPLRDVRRGGEERACRCARHARTDT